MTSADDALARTHPADHPASPVGGPVRAPRAARGNVRTLSRSGRSCARPGCPAPAQATLVFRYEDREAELLDLTDEPTPAAYDLCEPHAGRTHPPHGWALRDRRCGPTAPGRRLEDTDETVAVLAAALGRTPDADAPSARTSATLSPPTPLQPPISAPAAAAEAATLEPAIFEVEIGPDPTPIRADPNAGAGSGADGGPPTLWDPARAW